MMAWLAQQLFFMAISWGVLSLPVLGLTRDQRVAGTIAFLLRPELTD